MTTGQVVPQPQTPQQTIVFTMLVAFLVFIISGPQSQAALTHKINVLRPNAPSEAAPASSWLTVSNAIGWSVMFLFLLVMSDVSATAQLAQAFAWLILISILLTNGTAAMTTLGNLTKIGGTAPASSTPLPPITPVTDHPGRGGQTG